MQQDIKRSDFLKNVVRVVLLAMLAFIILSLRSRIVSDPACSSCPENGACPGKQKCIRN